LGRIRGLSLKAVGGSSWKYSFAISASCRFLLFDGTTCRVDGSSSCNPRFAGLR